MKPYIKHLFFTFPVLAFHGFAKFLVKLFDGQAWETELQENKLASIVISALLGLLTAFCLYSIYSVAAK